jgi:hypothetical protein
MVDAVKVRCGPSLISLSFFPHHSAHSALSFLVLKKFYGTPIQSALWCAVRCGRRRALPSMKKCAVVRCGAPSPGPLICTAPKGEHQTSWPI